MHNQNANPDCEVRPNESSTLEPSVAIPEHTLLRRIGKGSYGDVWLARSGMGTYRAVKIVRHSDDEFDRSFKQEWAGIQKFEPISRQHEGLVDVLQVGGNRDHFYYVMELGDDIEARPEIDPDRYVPKTLAKELARKRRLPVEQCIRLGLSLSDALTFLHEYGLVHRDIKPSNIIFANGSPKLADIGLVSNIETAKSFVGTQGFVPPEGPGSVQADIFSLGKVLYEASTGRDRNDFPGLPPEFDDFSDAEKLLELNEVLIKACEVDRKRRYQSAKDMHAELVVVLNGKSVKQLHGLQRLVARGTKALIAGAVMLVASWIAYSQISRVHHIAAEARQRQIGGLIADGTHAMQSGDLLGAVPSFVEALQLDAGNADQEHTHRTRLGAVLQQSPKLVQLWSDRGQMHCAQFSPDAESVLTVALSGTAQIRNLHTGEPMPPIFKPDQGLESAAFSPDGKLIVTASFDKLARIWNVESGKEMPPLRHPAGLYAARFSPESRFLVTACHDGKARIWNLATRENIAVAHSSAVTYAGFSPDGTQIVTTSKDNTARIWEASTGKPVGLLLSHNGWVYHASFSPDGKYLVTASSDRKARVWEIQSGRLILPTLDHGDAVHSAEFSPDGRLILTASLDATVRLWYSSSQQPLNPNPILRHSSRVMHASFSRDGRRIVSVCIDGTTRVWDLAPTTRTAMLTRNVFTHDGKTFLTANTNQIEVFDSRSTNRIALIQFTNSYVEHVKFNANGRFLLTQAKSLRSDDRTNTHVQVWHAHTGQAFGARFAFSSDITNAWLSYDGKRMVVTSGRIAQLYDIITGACSWSLPHTQAIAAVSFSPNSSALATAAKNLAYVWDINGGGLRFEPIRHDSPVSYLEFSHNDRWLVTCSSDNSLAERSARIWDAHTGKAVGKPLRHMDGVLYASFSPDDQQVVTASEDFTARVWHVETGRELTPPLQHDGQVLEARYSDEGRWIVTASSDKTARVWDAETGSPLTPPLKQSQWLWHGQFVAGAILTADNQGEMWLWPLVKDAHAIEDLTLLSQIFSSERKYGNDDAVLSNQSAIRNLWQMLKAKFPEKTAVTADEVCAWHEFEARASEEEGQWSAALFHLDWLVALRSNDPLLLNRRESALKQLRMRTSVDHTSMARPTL